MPAHISYLTGISFDKRLQEERYKEAMNDSDLADFVSVTERGLNLQRTLNFSSNILERIEKIVGPLGQVLDIVGSAPFTSIIQGALDIIGIGVHLVQASQLEQLSEKGRTLMRLVLSQKTPRANNKIFSPEKYFALYQANQSDVRGYAPLALMGQKYGAYVTWAYTDNPYYSNKFIDAVYIQITPTFNKESVLPTSNHDKPQKALEEIFATVFAIHANDVIISRVFAEEFPEDEASKLSSDERLFLDTMKSRNLFGIDLLSRVLSILLGLLDQTNNEDRTKGEETGKPIDRNLRVTIANKNMFTQELVEMAGDPSRMELTDTDPHIIIHGSFTNNDVPDQIKGSSPSSYFSKHIHRSDAFDPNTYWLRVPIKLVMALPNESPGAPKKDLVIPKGISLNNSDNDNNLVICVGGIEHNRALAHLINMHRWERKNDRQVGFLDNIMDYQRHMHRSNHKLRLEGAFLGGINMPVMGYNIDHIPDTRSTSEGFSAANRARLIYFSVGGVNVVGIYGFSAIASGMMLLWLIRAFRESANTNSIKFEISQVKYKLFNKDTGEPPISKLVWYEIHDEHGNPIPDNKVMLHIENEILRQTSGIDPFAFIANNVTNSKMVDPLFNKITAITKESLL